MSTHSMDNSNNTFSSRLTSARKKRGITQKDLAQEVGIHLTNIVKYENSKARPREKVLNNLARALDVDPLYLLNGDSGKNEITVEKNQIESLTDVIEEARNKIAEHARVSPDKVTIQVLF